MERMSSIAPGIALLLAVMMQFNRGNGAVSMSDQEGDQFRIAGEHFKFQIRLRKVLLIRRKQLLADT